VLAAPLADPAATEISALAAALAIDAHDRVHAPVQRHVPSGWRNVVSAPQTVTLGGHTVRYRLGRDGRTLTGHEGVLLVACSPHRVVLDLDGVRRAFDVAVHDDAVYVDSPLGPVALPRTPRFVDPADQLGAGSLTAPMPGTIARIAVAAGDPVRAGDPLLWLEAMKMQHRVDAPTDGVVTELPVAVGQQIEVGAVLAVVTAQEGAD